MDDEISVVDKVIEHIQEVRDEWRNGDDVYYTTREVMDAFNYAAFIVESYRRELDDKEKFVINE